MATKSLAIVHYRSKLNKHVTKRKVRNPIPIDVNAIDSQFQLLADSDEETKENSTQTIENVSPSQAPFIKFVPRKIKKNNGKIMDWIKFHRLADIYKFLDDLEKENPSICTVTVIGKSVEGRDLKLLKISNTKSGNKPVWLDGTIHPREWISTAVVTYLANVIVKNFFGLSTTITNKDWYILPVMNPDGYEYSHTKNRMWRKNRATYNGECIGVDLNRNFDFAWGENGEAGSSNDPMSMFYRGPAPFSEPETAAVRDVILNATTPFKVFLSFHSYFELIIFPWGNKNDVCPDYLRLLEGGVAMTKAIYEHSGIVYKVGCTKDLTYLACGTSIDWSYGIANIPYSYMIELRSKKHKFKLPRWQIHDTCAEIWSAVQGLMDFVDQQE